jgi:2-oxoglutarate dehydrogenase E2 component (dihydrolipoamide succinyltransferase)
MLIDVTVPSVGESITEGVLVEWVAREGARISVDDPLFVLETDKVTMTINASAAGQLKILVQPGETVAIGQKVAVLDSEGQGEAPAPPRPQAPPALAEPPAPAAAPPAPPPQSEGPRMVAPAGAGQMQEKAASGLLSPAVRRLVEEHGLDPGSIAGTGKGGRLTKEDVLRSLAARLQKEPGAEGAGKQGSRGMGEEEVTEPASAQAALLGPQTPPATVPKAPSPAAQPPGERQTRVPMTPLRARIAERLLIAKNQTAMLTTFNEADMTAVLALREKYRPVFKERHGVDLGFMSFFVKAAVDALKQVPQVNAQIQGNEIVQNHFYDIGVAVSSERGLVVPVVRDADKLSFAELERAIGDLAKKVRERTITLAELSGGVFTVSNGGIYGNLLSTPILNPPQSAILGMHAIKKRPVVVDDQIVIRPMMYLAVSYDHRLVDGREAVTFLKRIVQCVENPERMMLEI